MKHLVLLLAISTAASGSNRTWIPEVILWKTGRAIPGISIRGNDIVEWPQHEPRPTDEQLAAWKVEWETAKAAEKKVRDADELGKEEIIRWLELLTLKLVQKGVLTQDDIPKRVRDLISERRALRGDLESP